MVTGNTPKNLQELYKFYGRDNTFYPWALHSLPTLTTHFGHSPPPNIYLNPSILLLSEKLDFSIYEILESIQSPLSSLGPDLNDGEYSEINKYFKLDFKKGDCSTTTKVFKNIGEGLKNINKPINQFLNKNSRYMFKKITTTEYNYNDQRQRKIKLLPLENSYYFFDRTGGWSFSAGIFILKYGEEQPSFLNWRNSPF
tara:strand:- start:712 stop:1305 length:594 start_codon:yes stop_codon:yes gene_type:complete